jgi:hypothetical protein
MFLELRKKSRTHLQNMGRLMPYGPRGSWPVEECARSYAGVRNFLQTLVLLSGLAFAKTCFLSLKLLILLG